MNIVKVLWWWGDKGAVLDVIKVLWGDGKSTVVGVIEVLFWM